MLVNEALGLDDMVSRQWKRASAQGWHMSSLLLLFYAFDYTLLEKSTLSGPFFDNG